MAPPTMSSTPASAHRQREGERRPLSDLTLHPHASAVQLDELPRESQPETDALERPGALLRLDYLSSQTFL